jgi:SAM-dependent methyltransferase
MTAELKPPALARRGPPVYGATWSLLLLLLARSGIGPRLLRPLRARRGYLYGEARWDAEYSAGQWQFLHGLDQAAHYRVIELFRRRLKPGGAVLDVGCGEGVLYTEAEEMVDARYLGIDPSAAAIAGARHRAGPNARFQLASAENFATEERFDVIVLNESLYYCRDPRATVEKYAAMLVDDGIFIVSMALCGLRDGLTKLNIWRDIAATTVVVAETSLVAPSAAWIVKALRPKRA